MTQQSTLASSAGMWIKGEKKTAPSYPPKHHQYTKHKNQLFRIPNNMKTCPSTPQAPRSYLRSTFSLQPETNLFGKLRAVQNGTTQTASEHSTCWGQARRAGRMTHTNTHSQNGGFDRYFLEVKANYEFNINFTSLCNILKSCHASHSADSNADHAK